MKGIRLTRLGEFIEERAERLGRAVATVYSVTNDAGFVRSLDRFDKQVFSAEVGNYKRVEWQDLAYNPSRINVGSVAVCHDRLGGAVSPMYCIVRCKEGLLPGYLLRFLKSDVGLQQVRQRCEGSVRFQLKFRDLCEIPAHIPSVSEQERILGLLDESDALRNLRAEADRRTDELIPALFHEMFGDPAANPRGWPKKPVSAFVSHFQGGRNINPAGEEEAHGRYRVLKVSAVTSGEFKPDESKPVAATYDPPESHVVRSDDLLFSRANTTELVAATSYVFETPANLLLPDKLWRFVWKTPQRVEPLFVWWLFRAPSVRGELASRSTGTSGSMKNISMAKVMGLEVPVPPLADQREFSARAMAVREFVRGQSESREQMERLASSMRHRAFAGEM